MTHGPKWYRAMEGVSTRFATPPVPRALLGLGSLGDEPVAPTTLSQPTLQWQEDVLAQLRTGVATLQHGERTAELQKWLQIAATLSIPLAAAVWRMIFKRGADPTV
jgi:hypothetical protein